MAPVLSYSGRGRGGDGRGRRGRGGRFAVRFGGRQESGRGRGRGGQQNHQWVRSNNNKHNKNEDSDGDDNDTNKKNAERTTSMIGGVPPPPAPALPHSHAVMTKQGRNCLVLTSTKNESATSKVQSKSIATTTGATTAPVVQNAANDTPGQPPPEQKPTTKATATTVTSTMMMRDGGNKLVAVHLASEKAQATKRSREAFSTKRPSSGYDHHHSSHSNKYRQGQGHKKKPPPAPPAAPPIAKRIRLNVPQQQEQPKNTKEEKEWNESPQEEDDANSANPIGGVDASTTKLPPLLPATKEKWSDFAYRPTSRVRQRPVITTSHMQWSKNNSSKNANDQTSTTHSTQQQQQSRQSHQQHKNMGLVRLQQDVTSIPICGTFLRGLPCEDPFCRKRHDVPKESTMPVCKFFQQHGQCWKKSGNGRGDSGGNKDDSCPFRHVKVNPRAIICPSFALLGYCEDAECLMQHVRGGGGGGDRDDRGRRGTQSTRRNPKSMYKYQKKK